MIAPVHHTLVMLMAAGFVAARDHAAPRVEMELVTERGFPITGSHDWSRLLTGLGVSGLRIRSLRTGEVFQPRIDETGTRERPRYRLRGVLTAHNTLRLSGGTFRIREQARLKRYLATLDREGAVGVTAKKERFGLSLPALAAVTDTLSGPLDLSTKGTAPAAVLGAARLQTGLTIVVDADANAVLDRAELATDEVRGLSVGTALAAILARDGLIFQPRRLRAAPVQLAVQRAHADRDAWPVGWPPERKPHQLVPTLFESLSVEIRGRTLADTLAALEPRIDIPVLIDHRGLARQKIDPAQIKVSFPARRTFYKRVLDRVLFQARLRAVLRVDEAGRPFVWITPIRRETRP